MIAGQGRRHLTDELDRAIVGLDRATLRGADRILAETDSPYLAPQPVRGKPNEPANVPHTARWVAELRGVTYEELERTVAANFERVFGP